MTSRKVFFLLLTFLCFFISCTTTEHNTPRAKDGVLDLSHWELERDGKLFLNGEWRFYWNELLEPGQILFNDSQGRYDLCEVPGTWNKHILNGASYPGMGHGTFVLYLVNERNSEIKALRLPEVSSAYKLYVNGKLLSQNGQVSANLAETVPQYLPIMRVFEQTTDTIQLVFQVSNNFHINGGIWAPIHYGEQKSIFTYHYAKLFYTIFVAGLVFILFIYHIWFFLNRKKEKASLGFGLLCLVLLLRTALTDERVLYVMLPNLSVNLGLRLEYLTMPLSVTVGAFVYSSIFVVDFSKRGLKILYGFTLLECLFILLTPASVYSHYVLIFQLAIFCKSFFILFTIARSVRKRRPGALHFFISFLILIATVVNDVLVANLVIQSPYLLNYGFLFFIISQAYFLSSRITTAFNTVEDLSVNLEKKVKLRTQELAEEKEITETLLLNILPQEVADELKASGSTKARMYENVSVLFTDFVGFTTVAEKLSAVDLVAEIHKNFTAFDAIMERHGLEKIKTIGDAYLAVSGLPNQLADHAERAILAGLDIAKYIRESDSLFKIRIGIHSGHVVAGVVGVKKYAYDIWGDTVNTAARLEQNSEPGRVNISATTHALVKHQFDFVERGEIAAKNKGVIAMYFVLEGIISDIPEMSTITY